MKKKKTDIEGEYSAADHFIRSLSDRMFENSAIGDIAEKDWNKELLRQWTKYRKTAHFRKSARQAILNWLEVDLNNPDLWEQMLMDECWQQLKDDLAGHLADVMLSRVKKRGAGR